MQSRVEEILQDTVDGVTTEVQPRSRVEELLVKLNEQGGGGGGSVVSVETDFDDGVKVATVTVNGDAKNIYVPEVKSTVVSVTPVVTEGTTLATINVDGVNKTIKAPVGVIYKGKVGVSGREDLPQLTDDIEGHMYIAEVAKTYHAQAALGSAEMRENMVMNQQYSLDSKNYIKVISSNNTPNPTPTMYFVVRRATEYGANSHAIYFVCKDYNQWTSFIGPDGRQQGSYGTRNPFCTVNGVQYYYQMYTFQVDPASFAAAYAKTIYNDQASAIAAFKQDMENANKALPLKKGDTVIARNRNWDVIPAGDEIDSKIRILAIDAAYTEAELLELLTQNEGYECSGFWYNADEDCYCEFEGLYQGKKIGSETVHFGYCHIHGLHTSEYEADYYIDDEDGSTWHKRSPTAGGINYSTEEQIVGTWIDGSTLYQKTIDPSEHNISASGWTTIAQSPQGIDTLVNAIGIRALSGKSVFTPQLYRIDGGSIKVYSTLEWEIDYLTIQYTKTT